MKTIISILITTLMITPMIGQNLSNLGAEKPFKLTSGLSLSTSYYTVSGRESRQEPFAWRISGSPTINVYGFSMPFSFQVSDQHKSFQQPFNQFGVTPTYKWVKVHAGYSSINFSKYTLANHRFLGAGVELTPGNFRFSAMYGRLRKAIPVDTETNSNNQFLSNVPIPSFSRKGYGIKVGYGGKKNFIDLSFFKAKDKFEDDIEFIDKNILPEENAAVGIKSQITFLKNISWSLEIGLSAYTRNQLADSLDTDDVPLRNVLRKLLDPTETSQLTIGGETGLAYQGKVFGLSLDYIRIEPEYKTMGAYYFTSDVTRTTIAPSLRLNQGKLTLNSSLGLQRNNILNTRINTAKRFIGSLQVNYNPNEKFGLFANYVNYGITQRPVERSTAADTIVIEQVNQNFSVGPRWQFGHQDRQQSVSVHASYQSLTDRQATESNAGLKAINLTATYSYSLREQGLNTSANINYRTTDNILGKTHNIGLSASIAKSFNDRKYQISLNGGYFNNSYGNSSTGNTIRLGSTVNIRLWDKHSITLNNSWIKNTADNTILSTSFNEFRSNLTYNLSL